MTLRRPPSLSLPVLMRNLLPCLLCLLCLLCLPPRGAAAQANGQMRLASLEWLPYVGAALDQGGLSVAVVQAATGKFGYDTKIEHFPWNRAMQLGGEDPRFAGYFPAYYTEERARLCYFSAAFGHSSVGLAYLKSQPLQWRKVADLAGMRIGVVAGYSNGGEFDALVKQGKLHIDASPGDAFNVKKMLAGRVRVAVIDKSVLRYLLLSDPDLRKERAQIVFHDNILAELPLHICFQRTPAGLKMQRAFDDGLRRIDIAKIENAYFQQLESKVKPGAP